MSYPRGIATNGVGEKTDAHLNLTRSLADAWDWHPPTFEPYIEPRRQAAEPREAPAPKIPYAGSPVLVIQGKRGSV